MRIAITGTPGTGKSSVAGLLSEKYEVHSVKELAESYECSEKDDTGELLVDVDCLKGKIGNGIIEGHLSHLLNPDLIILLRCNPEVLRKRLEGRGYSDEKLRENLEAEAVDVILEEALETGRPVFEIDSTERSAEETASAIIDILNGNTEGYEAGKIDWSEVVLSWY